MGSLVGPPPDITANPFGACATAYPDLVAVGAPVALYAGQLLNVNCLFILTRSLDVGTPNNMPGGAICPFANNKYRETVFGDTPRLYVSSTFVPSSPVVIVHCVVDSSAIAWGSDIPKFVQPDGLK